MGGIISTSHDSKSYNADNFTDDDVSDPVWTSTEEHELMRTVLSKIDWDALADILQEKDIDKTGQECRDWISRKFAELRGEDDEVNATGSQG